MAVGRLARCLGRDPPERSCDAKDVASGEHHQKDDRQSSASLQMCSSAPWDERVDGKDVSAERVRGDGAGRLRSDAVQTEQLEHCIMVVEVVQVLEAVFELDRRPLNPAGEVVEECFDRLRRTARERHGERSACIRSHHLKRRPPSSTHFALDVGEATRPEGRLDVLERRLLDCLVIRVAKPVVQTPLRDAVVLRGRLSHQRSSKRRM